jgi:hypothetical protein
MTTRRTKQWQRNTEGLRAHAQKKAEQTKLRAEDAITLLLHERRPINFKTVAETARISTAWLYGNDTLKQRIIQLRAHYPPKPQVKIPPKEQASSASKEAMIAALQKRVRAQAAEIEQLKRQVEVAYGLLHRQEGGRVEP